MSAVTTLPLYMEARSAIPATAFLGYPVAKFSSVLSVTSNAAARRGECTSPLAFS